MTIREWSVGPGSGLVFFPYVYKFAARLEQVDVRQMLTDPGTMTRCLRGAQRLFGYDGVVNSFDATLEAEACGCGINWSTGLPVVVKHAAAERGLDGVDARFASQGRVPVVIEATKRLRGELRGEVSLLGGVTGPLTLAAQLLGDSLRHEMSGRTLLAQDLLDFAGDACLALSRRYCEIGVDGILIVEDVRQAGDDLAPLVAELRSPLRTLRNVAQYFGVPLVLAARGAFTMSELNMLEGLPVDGLSVGGVSPSADALELEPGAVRVLGLGIPSAAFTVPGDNPADCVKEVMGGTRSPGLFLTSEWEMPIEASPEKFHEVIKAIDEYRGH